MREGESMKRKFIHPSVDSCKCRHDIMTAAAAPVHFDLDMKLCSGLHLCPSERQLRTHGLIMVPSLLPSSAQVSWEDNCPADTLSLWKLFFWPRFHTLVMDKSSCIVHLRSRVLMSPRDASINGGMSSLRIRWRWFQISV